MMVKMLRKRSTPRRTYSAEETVDLPKGLAEAWISMGIAEAPKKEVSHETESPRDASMARAQEIRHVGAGWYELPNGKKIRGKEKAKEAVKGEKGRS